MDEEDLIAQLRQNVYQLQIISNARKRYIETLLQARELDLVSNLADAVDRDILVGTHSDSPKSCSGVSVIHRMRCGDRS